MRIILGVCGGIAAYKSCELLRLLQKEGHEIKVVMTKSAQEFIHANTMAALSQCVVYDDLFDCAKGRMIHIDLAKWCDLVVIAPASATTLADLACGRAANLLTGLCLATQARCVLAPAMNQNMWAHPMTQANVARLTEIGHCMVAPVSGQQACGDIGVGRMATLQSVVDFIELEKEIPQTMQGKRVLITAGPTHEPIDPLRFISNHSSGQMGFALARSCLRRGAQVDLVVGPTSHQPPAGCQVFHVQTAAEMMAAVGSCVKRADVFMGAAAVADYTPIKVSLEKIKKTPGSKFLALHRTEDIIARVAVSFPNIFTVGFCAETQDLLENARGKMEKKQVNVVIANTITSTGFPMGAVESELVCLSRSDHKRLKRGPKKKLAEDVMDFIIKEMAYNL